MSKLFTFALIFALFFLAVSAKRQCTCTFHDGQTLTITAQTDKVCSDRCTQLAGLQVPTCDQSTCTCACPRGARPCNAGPAHAAASSHGPAGPAASAGGAGGAGGASSSSTGSASASSSASASASSSGASASGSSGGWSGSGYSAMLPKEVQACGVSHCPCTKELDSYVFHV
eukprot:gene1293-1634_t